MLPPQQFLNLLIGTLLCGLLLGGLVACAPKQTSFVHYPIRSGYDGTDIYPTDNDEGYIPPRPRPAPPSYPEDNDNAYVPPQGGGAHNADQGSYYTDYYAPYQPSDNRGTNTPDAQDPYDTEREIDMLRVYPLYY